MNGTDASSSESASGGFPAQGPALGPLLRRAVPFVVPYRGRLAFVFALAFVTAALSAGEPLALKLVFDELAGARALAPLFGFVAIVLAVMLARELVAAVLDANIWKVRIGVHYEITHATVERLHALPLAYHRDESVGAIMTKMDRGINGFAAAFSEVAFNVLPALVYLVLAAAVMLRMDWRLFLIVAALAPIAPVVGARASKEQVQRERSLLKRWTRVFSRFNEVLSGIAVVKSFVMEENEKRRFLSGVSEANAIVVRGVRTDARTTALKNTGTVLARIGCLGVGAWLIVQGEMTVGTLVAFLGYVGALLGPVQGLTGAYQTLRRGTVSLETIFSILDAQDSLGDAPHAIDPGPLSGAVEFRDVSFGYRPESLILRHVDLEVSPGETIALVGPSGGGKTTLMKLLQRLYDPLAGQILVDGIDLRDLKQRSLRLEIGVVLQEPGLFSDTIRENIAFGRPDATFDEIVASAKAAHAHDFIMATAKGYETKVGDRGSRLSAGQAQRIAIARALLKNPPILVLDEATSALDAESESLIQSAIAQLTRGRTTFIIAHRLSTVVNADRIVVIADGRVAEVGTHDELLRRGEIYAKLVAKQTLRPAA